MNISFSSSGLSPSYVQKTESYVFIPADKIKITRLTHEDLPKLSLSSPPTLKSLNEEIVSPIYETIDEKRGDSIDKTHRLETLC